ncbi:MAG: hypothetical protein HRT69_18190 [Flavobacteriaceae bacterium]|nr:hypothetical protein [Flavobacteriaceae bacterium]
MKLKLIFITCFLILSSSIYSQEKLEKVKYITSDKLKYIIIQDDFRFVYQAYKGYSPYTIKEKRKRENKPQMCGTVGYFGDGKGNGVYSILDGNLVLKFEVDVSSITTKKIDTRLSNGLSFKLSELEILDD